MDVLEISYDTSVKTAIWTLIETLRTTRAPVKALQCCYKIIELAKCVNFDEVSIISHLCIHVYAILHVYINTHSCMEYTLNGHVHQFAYAVGAAFIKPTCSGH